MTGRLNGRTVIVTGAGQGIGRTFAHRLATDGANVVILDLNFEAARRVADEIGDRAIARSADVADEQQVATAFQAAVDRFGRVDGLINNASIFATIRMGPFEQITLDEWNAIMRVNLTGVFICCKAVAPLMRQHRSGNIVNISSSTVLMGRRDYAHYVSSKAGVVGLTRALATELGDDGIRVNAIMPGSVETEIPRETVTTEQAAGIVARQALHRRLKPDDIAGAAAFLVSPDAEMMTGQILVVDGGLSYH
jgi:3-oxoacyl-[acyl-carrier protein] reductase